MDSVSDLPPPEPLLLDPPEEPGRRRLGPRPRPRDRLDRAPRGRTPPPGGGPRRLAGRAARRPRRAAPHGGRGAALRRVSLPQPRLVRGLPQPRLPVPVPLLRRAGDDGAPRRLLAVLQPREGRAADP